MAAMENVASIALTASLRTELSKMNSYAQPEDMLPDAPTGDSLSVDWFLDSPVGHGADELCTKEDEKEEKDSIFNHSSVSSCSFLSSEFSVPDDDLPDLEYLVSNLLDDSLCELSVSLNEERAENRTARLEPEPETVASMGATNVLFPCQVPGKARSKRPRPTNKTRTWFPLSEPSSLSSTLSNSLPTPCAIGMVQPVDSGHNFDEPSTKKLKKGQPVRAEEEASSTQFQRRCSHCQVQKTPQWRAGPLGPKTLCNACGVRHKSGRLFPEYRPACSPTFLRDIHSNSHRKVLEMRKRKGIRESVPGLSQLIPNF